MYNLEVAYQVKRIKRSYYHGWSNSIKTCTRVRNLRMTFWSILDHYQDATLARKVRESQKTIQ